MLALFYIIGPQIRPVKSDPGPDPIRNFAVFVYAMPIFKHSTWLVYLFQPIRVRQTSMLKIMTVGSNEKHRKDGLFCFRLAR